MAALTDIHVPSKRKALTPERLKELIRYEPETGSFYWRKNMKGGKRAGDLAGYNNDKGPGYTLICIDGRMYAAHRLAWLYMKGVWPDFLIDHKNTNKTDNRFENLRPATHTQNHANQRIGRKNTSGFKGVSYASQRIGNKWNAYITVNSRRKNLGYFATREEAAKAYQKAAQAAFGEFARFD